MKLGAVLAVFTRAPAHHYPLGGALQELAVLVERIVEAAPKRKAPAKPKPAGPPRPRPGPKPGFRRLRSEVVAMAGRVSLGQGRACCVCLLCQVLPFPAPALRWAFVTSGPCHLINIAPLLPPYHCCSKPRCAR